MSVSYYSDMKLIWGGGGGGGGVSLSPFSLLTSLHPLLEKYLLYFIYIYLFLFILIYVLFIN